MSLINSHPQVLIRWLIRRDLPDVMRIDRQSYDDPWTEADFRWHMTHRNVISLVAELEDQVVGYMTYELQKSRINLLRMVVDPHHRRQGIGSAMLLRLIDKLHQFNRTEITTITTDLEEAAHHFLKANNCYAIKTLRQHFNQTNPPRDGYLFRYQLPEPENREYDWSFILGDEDIELKNNTHETNTPEPGWDFQI